MRGLSSHAEGLSLRLFREVERQREVLHPLRTPWIVTWALLGFSSQVYARLVEDSLLFSLFVRQPTNKTLTLSVLSTSTVQEVKLLIQRREGFSTSEQRLTFKGQHLADERTLTDCGIQRDFTIDLALRRG